MDWKIKSIKIIWYSLGHISYLDTLHEYLCSMLSTHIFVQTIYEHFFLAFRLSRFSQILILETIVNFVWGFISICAFNGIRIGSETRFSLRVVLNLKNTVFCFSCYFEKTLNIVFWFTLISLKIRNLHIIKMLSKARTIPSFSDLDTKCFWFSLIFSLRFFFLEYK